MESDFYREYNIDLAKEFYTLSWRRFIIYLSGLSKDSAFFTVLLNQKQEEDKLDDPADIAAAIKRARKQK